DREAQEGDVDPGARARKTRRPERDDQRAALEQDERARRPRAVRRRGGEEERDAAREQHIAEAVARPPGRKVTQHAMPPLQLGCGGLAGLHSRRVRGAPFCLRDLNSCLRQALAPAKYAVGLPPSSAWSSAPAPFESVTTSTVPPNLLSASTAASGVT